MTSNNPEVRYCYRCGKRQGAQHEKCWYCGTTTERQIRPPRQCPYCRQEMPHDALKCRHCGEFLDGRPTSAQAASGQTVNFVIDKAVFNGEKSLQMQGGVHPDQNVSAYLSDQTKEAIQSGKPELIDQQGVQALPPPNTPTDNDQNTYAIQPTQQALTPHTDPKPQQTEIIEAKTIETQTKDQPTEDSKYATCPVCQTEILTQDSYCFHCGTLRTTPQNTKKSKKQLKKAVKSSAISNTTYHILTIILSITTAFLGITQIIQFTYWRWEIRSTHFIAILAPVCLLLIAAAYMRKRNFLSITITTLVALFWFISFIAAILGRAFLGID